MSQSSTPSSEHLTGLIERVTFHSPESGFCVLRVDVKGQRERVTVIGSAPEVRAGEWLDATGRWTMDVTHGRQFRAHTLRTTHPDTLDGMRKYLGSGLIKGIGPEFASRLVKAFGTRIFDVIETDPQRLLDVEGIGPQRRARITAAWRDQKAVRQIMVFLHSHGVGTSRAFRIYKAYGDAAIETVKQDPYRLARDIRGIGFKTADQIAMSLGIDPQSDLRARAGVEYVLQELTDAGHCAYPRPKLVETAAKMLQIQHDVIECAIDHGIGEGRLVGGFSDDGTSLVYLSSLEYAERALAEDLMELAQGAHPCPAIDADQAIDHCQRTMGLTLAPKQREAVAQAIHSKLLVITGGPGVGKTTIVRGIVQILAAQQLQVVLCAPTGRAAKRLSETSGTQAKTIHRLLEFDPKTGGFKHDGRNPLEGDVFIIDEMSMVDLVLAHQLIGAIPRRAAVIFVGDVDQLPAVGPGTVLRDLIESGVFPVCRLTEVFRQAAQSAIITNAHRINRGLMPQFPESRPQDAEALSDFYFIPADEPAKAIELLLHLIRKSIPRRFQLHPLDDIQVLTPMQRGDLGARKLNMALQAALNSAGPAIERYGWTFRVGDKVMQTVNDYDKDVFNGDIGRVTSIDEVEQELTVRFDDDRTVGYDFHELDELTLAYATTVHKAQGSEYPAVIIPLHTQHYTMLQRNLLYTAVTRGKKLVVLLGSRKAIALALRRTDLMKRTTTLAGRLQAELAVH